MQIKRMMRKLAGILAWIILLQGGSAAWSEAAPISLLDLDEATINANLDTGYLVLPPQLLRGQSYTSTKTSSGAIYWVYLTSQTHASVTSVTMSAIGGSTGIATQQSGTNNWRYVFNHATGSALDVTTLVTDGTRNIEGAVFRIDPTRASGIDRGISPDTLSSQSPTKLADILARGDTAMFQRILTAYASELQNVTLVTASAIQGVVGFNPLTERLTGTTTGMQYSTNATSYSNGTWLDCSAPTTPVIGYSEGRSILVRDKIVTKHWASISTALQSAGPVRDADFTLDFVGETLTNNHASRGMQFKVGTGGSYIDLATGAAVSVSSLIPATLYLRFAADATTTASRDTSVSLPARPVAPSYTIDYGAGTTNQVVPVTVEYSKNSGATWSLAPGTKVDLTSSGAIVSTLFRTKAVATRSFKGHEQALDPGGSAGNRPTLVVNFSDERVDVPIYMRGNIQSSTDLVTWTTRNANIVLADIGQAPGTTAQNLYLRYIGQTVYQTLAIPARPNLTAPTVNYQTGQTMAVIPATMEYKIAAGDYVGGAGLRLSLDIGKTYTFRLRSTDRAFASATATLGPLERMAAPVGVVQTLDYLGEKTAQSFTDIYEYVIREAALVSPDFTGAITCNGQITVQPGMTIYLRRKSDGAKLPSDYVSIAVKARPDTDILVADLLAINFETETVRAGNTSGYAYQRAGNATFTTDVANYTAAAPSSIVPGTTYYFRYTADVAAERFASLSVKFTAPGRPAIITPRLVGSDIVVGDTTLKYGTSLDANGNIIVIGNAPVTIEAAPPGTYYFQRPALAGVHFASAIVTVTVP
jgi:hypothetical protein